MSEITFAILPIRFYPYPRTERDGIAVGRTISLNALQNPIGVALVPQRFFSAQEVKDGTDLLRRGVIVTTWEKVKEEKNIWWIKTSLGNAIQINEIWFDNEAQCFVGKGNLIPFSPYLSDKPDFALADACIQIFQFFNMSDFFELVPTLKAIIQKTYNQVRNKDPLTISSSEGLQQSLYHIIIEILQFDNVAYFMLPSDYESIVSTTNFRDFVMEVLNFVKALKIRIEEVKKVREEAEESAAKHQRLAFLSHLRDAINTEIKEISYTTGDSEADELLKEIQTNPNLPEQLKAKLREEVESVAGYTTNPERPIVLRHVRFVLSLPWGKYVEPNTNLSEVITTLENSHYGLFDAKERISEYLALYTHLKRPPKGNILCFIGPPGTGKTSMAAAVAEALKLPFYRVSLGGVSDEAEIKGHRRTYIGAMPGRIASALAQLKALNGIIFLDEIDKLGLSYRGRPDAALLDALDPDRNHDFFDHYVDYPIDLSNILFICGANVQENIDPILADRMEFIQFNGYLLPEKFQIVKHYLIPTIRKNWQITEEHVTITDDAISYIIKTWGRWEAGIREVKRQVESALRKALCFQEKRVTARFIQRHFPPPVPLVEWKNEYAQRVGYIPVVGVNRSGEGVVFWVEIHKIDQATNNNSPWNIEIVGNADDSMRESIKSSFLWCRHHIPTFDNANTKWIVYLPSVSLPRGGPSASLAITVGLICTHLNRPIGRLVAMTGEISASGEILPVGGLPAKIVAAENAGLEEILIPAANKDEVDYWLRKSRLSHRIKITPVETIEEVLAHLDIKLEKHAS